jgi:hypothetical protein
MDRMHWEAHSRPPSQEIPHYLQNPKVDTVHENPPQDPILSHLNPIHILTMILPFRFSVLNSVSISNLLHACYILRQAHPRWWVEHANPQEMRNVFQLLVEKPGGKRPFGRPRRRWEDNSKPAINELPNWMLGTGLENPFTVKYSVSRNFHRSLVTGQTIWHDSDSVWKTQHTAVFLNLSGNPDPLHKILINFD